MAGWRLLEKSEHTRRGRWGAAIAHATWKCSCGALAVTPMVNTDSENPPGKCGVCKR